MEAFVLLGNDYEVADEEVNPLRIVFNLCASVIRHIKFCHYCIWFSTACI